MMRRGFALTLSMIVLIFFLTLILSVESQRIVVEEQTRANHAQMRAITSLVADIDSPAMGYAIEKMAKRSLYEVDWKVITTQQPSKQPKQEVLDSFTDKFNGYLLSLQSRANDSGLNLKYDTPEITLEQLDAFTLQVNASTRLIITGKDIMVIKYLSQSRNISIEGIYDPLISLRTYDKNLDIPTNSILIPIIKSKIKASEFSKEPTVIASGYGRGWTYGEVISAEKASSLPSTEWGNWIIQLNGEDLQEWPQENLSKFKGVILISSSMAASSSLPLLEVPGTDSIGKPCTINVSSIIWNENTAPCIMCGTYQRQTVIKRSVEDCVPVSALSYPKGEVSNTYYLYTPAGIINDPNNLQSRKNILLPPTVAFLVTGSSASSGKVLLSSEIEDELQDTLSGAYPPIHGGMRAYNIEKQRAAILCANYFAWGAGRGPDIFSRLSNTVSAGDRHGIETFLVGPDWPKNYYSKIDWEFYKPLAGNLVKGMPGCITPQMCNQNAKELQIDHFRISQNSGSNAFYNMDELYVQK